jgi:CBS domain-containing protein
LSIGTSNNGSNASQRSRRASYLIAGRRVRVADLVEAGLLVNGSELFFRRPNLGMVYAARVTEGHRLTLPDGRQFVSPSRAATAAVGGGSFDGWNAWALRDGTTLDDLRQQLLDSLAAAPVAESGEEDPSIARHEELKRARNAAARGKPISLSVRDLLNWWGAARRGYIISSQIGAELANHALTTVPDFEAVPLDARVRLMLVPDETESGPETGTDAPKLAEANPLATVSVEAATDGQHAPDGESQSVGVPSRTETEPAARGEDGTAAGAETGAENEPITGLTVGNLDSAFSGIVSVTASASFDEAVTKMILNGYSQLPVMAGERRVVGAVTWQSMATARHSAPDAPLSQAIVPAHTVPYDNYLVDVLPQLAEYGFVLVKNEKNIITGIVTSDDAAARYGALATPFSLIGELDQRLRRVLSDTVDQERAISLCDSDGTSGISSFDDMSFGDYQRILEEPSLWAELEWPLDRKTFVKRLDEVRRIRNDLMHFNSDGVGDDDVKKIRRMIDVLRNFGGS